MIRNVSNTLVFPPDVLVTNIAVQIVNDFVYRGDRSFSVQLTSPPSGWSIAYPNVVTVTILDDNPTSTTNSYNDVVFTNWPAPGTNSLQVFLTPTNAVWKWRFIWETEWRDSGSTA